MPGAMMEVQTFANPKAWRGELARLWMKRIQAQPDMRICLAAGNTPEPVCREMARLQQAGEVSFREAQIFVLDEYGEVPPENPGRCANMIRHYLVDHVDLPAEQFHFLATESDELDTMCAQFDAAIGEGFDLAILGVGLNGHLGMNEPGTAPDTTTHRVELHTSSVHSASVYGLSNDPPRWGITVGLKHLRDARTVWLLASGTKKAEIVRKIVKGEISSNVPASLMRKHPDCTLFLDAEAAIQL